MGFYVTRETGKCPKAGCTKLATHRVNGPRNESYGEYCEPHAKAHAKHLEKAHAEYEARSRQLG